MFLSTILVTIKEVYGMIKNSTKPTNSRSIEVRKYPQHARDFDVPDDDITDPHHANHHFTDEFAERRQNTPLKVISQEVKLVKQTHTALHTHSSNHSVAQTELQSSSTTHSSPLKGLTFYAKFYEVWHHHETIGEGGDGIVDLYHRPDDRSVYVAVKTPRSHSARHDLEKEIMNMRLLGKHEHILALLFASKNWFPCGPAMFIPYCEMGSLIHYRESWCAQQTWNGQPERVTEITMLKLFQDMVLALKYLHSELGTRYVHNDFKPANILAVVPSDTVEYRKVPEEPTFKLSDFARLTPWPTPRGKPAQRFDGTPEYAPPRHEQRAPVLPSADIWGLGATLQFMALGINPVQSKRAFILDRKAKGKSYPKLSDKSEWLSEYWRTRISTVFRPLNVPVEVLRADYDLVWDLPGYQHYGICLGYWYAQLWKPAATRPKASKLANEAIPHMKDVVERLKRERIKLMGKRE